MPVPPPTLPSGTGPLVATANASDGPVAEGSVGGGTGMICHEFKGGTGTSSRVVGRWRVGALVQANYGDREHLTIDGVPLGRELPRTAVPSAWDEEEAIAKRGAGSIIAIVATDAPILPHQLTRLAQRAGLGIARMGGSGAHSSGDIFLAFSTANAKAASVRDVATVQMLSNDRISAVFSATVQATEEAILNALVGAETMKGPDRTIEALPHDTLRQLLKKYGR